MSHFTVMVIGNDPENQLEPFWELDLSPEDMKNDPRAVFTDTTEEYREQYLTKKAHMISLPGGERMYPWSEEYKKWCADRGLLEGREPFKTTPKNLPEGVTRIEVPFTELFDSFEKFVKEWHSEKLVDGHCGYYHNPNAKWDWHQLGGRWTGFFKLKSPGFGKTGTPGIMTERPKKGYADQALKRDIDFEGMFKEEVKRQMDLYYKFHAAINGRPFPIWDEVREKYADIDEARKAYHSNPAVKAVAAAGFHFDYDNYLKSEEDFRKSAEGDAVSTFAVLKDGKWYEKGSMGWWGIVSDKKDNWSEEFRKLLDSIPDDTLLSVYDCHI